MLSGSSVGSAPSDEVLYISTGDTRSAAVIFTELLTLSAVPAAVARLSRGCFMLRC